MRFEHIPTNDEGAPIVRYAAKDGVATVTMNRPRYRNAQNAQMTHALDACFRKAIDDDDVKVIVLAGAGKHFSAGHDIGTPGRDIHRDFERIATSWWPHEQRDGAEAMFVREAELYVGMCKRWRELPKPTIASIQGACVAGGLMLAWCCDLIVASDDAFFADPVVRMGIPGVEFFAHPYALPTRIARELLFCGDRLPAQRAYEVGMVNRVVPREQLTEATAEVAAKVAKMPRFGLALTKQALNQAEDRQGLQDTIAATYGLHHLAHAHNALTSTDHLAGQDAKSMKKALEPSK